MLVQIILAVLILSIIVWGLEISPLPAGPKRLVMAAVVVLTGLSLAHQAGLLR